MSWKEHFLFLPRIDQFGCEYDYKGIKYINVNDIINNDDIFGFNSKNDIKNNIMLLKLDDTFKSDEGIYIKKNKLNDILNNLNNSDYYLHIDNKQEIDDFIDKIKFKGPEGDTVIFTNANSWYIDTLVLNLIKSYDSFNKDKNRKIGVFCSDNEAYDKCIKLNFECCMFKCEKMNIKNSLTNIKADEYKRLTFVKTLIIDYIISKEITVLYIDPDMSFNFKLYPHIDFIDEILKRKHSINYNFDTDKSIININNIDIKVDNVMSGYIYKSNNITSIYLNTNLMLVSPTFFNKILFKINESQFEYICTELKNGTDENYIYRFNKSKDYFSFWNETYYPNGNNLIKYKNTAYMFHANCVDGLKNKIKLLKECGGWYLENELINTDEILNVSKITLQQWQNILKKESNLIVQASQHDITDTFCSIGMSVQYLNRKNKLDYKKHQIGIHNNLVLCAININNDTRRRNCNIINRKNIVNTLKYNKIENKNYSPDEYFEMLPTYKFIISPEGNGIDCHRHYESLIAGCVPIVEDNPLIRKKYEGCPILYTKDYSEITEEYLNKKYEELKTQLFDFSRLLLSNYSDEQQYVIKTRGNYWCNRLVNKYWYNLDKDVDVLYNNFLKYNNYDIMLLDKNYETYSLKDSKNNPIDIKLSQYLLNYKKNGIFLDINCKDGITNNNTYLMEKKYDWKGILIESSPNLINLLIKNRSSKNIYINDIIYNYQKLIDKYNIKEIDFLNIDTDDNKFDFLQSINMTLCKPKYIFIKIYNNELENICRYLCNYYNMIGNISDYNTYDNPEWKGTYNYYLFSTFW